MDRIRRCDIQVWEKRTGGLQLWWKPTRPGSNRAGAALLSWDLLRCHVSWSKASIEAPLENSTGGLKHWKRHQKKFQKTEVSINKQPSDETERKKSFGCFGSWRAWFENYHPLPALRQNKQTKTPQLFSPGVSACAVGWLRLQIFKEQLIPELFQEFFFYRKAVV